MQTKFDNDILTEFCFTYHILILQYIWLFSWRSLKLVQWMKCVTRGVLRWCWISKYTCRHTNTQRGHHHFDVWHFWDERSWETNYVVDQGGEIKKWPEISVDESRLLSAITETKLNSLSMMINILTIVYRSCKKIPSCDQNKVLLSVARKHGS